MNTHQKFIDKIWPQCAQCQKPVDKFNCTYSPLESGYYAVAHCHGEQEKYLLPAQPFIFNPIIDGVAFKNKTKVIANDN